MNRHRLFNSIGLGKNLNLEEEQRDWSPGRATAPAKKDTGATRDEEVAQDGATIQAATHHGQLPTEPPPRCDFCE